MQKMTIKTLGKQDERQALQEHNKAESRANLIDSHIKQIHTQTIPVDCVELHGEYSTTICVL